MKEISTIQLKDLAGDEIKELQKTVNAVQDSIKSVQDKIFGKKDPKAQGITSRDFDKYANGKVFMAVRQISSRPGLPTITEERLVNSANIKIKEGVDIINKFYEDVWPDFRKEVENTEISLLKEYKPLRMV